LIADLIGSENLNVFNPARSCSHTRIRITHGGLQNGASCPVHAPQKTWRILKKCKIDNPQLIKERAPTEICGITFEAFPVEHSILAPAVAYRVSAGDACIFMDQIFCSSTIAAQL